MEQWKLFDSTKRIELGTDYAKLKKERNDLESYIMLAKDDPLTLMNLLKEVKRKLWVLEGYLNQGYPIPPLIAIYNKYKYLELVPEQYFYPELVQISQILVKMN